MNRYQGQVERVDRLFNSAKKLRDEAHLLELKAAVLGRQAEAIEDSAKEIDRTLAAWKANRDGVPPCDCCAGSEICQTCKGTGMVERNEMSDMTCITCEGGLRCVGCHE